MTLSTTTLMMGLAQADQVILDDLIVNGSNCVGQDCVNGESFGFDTIRLKENNLRIRFQDTSSSASFPTNDWQITVNDSANGGQNKFSIDDVDGGRTPFTIEAGTPSHTLYVDSAGRLGIGTNNPVVDIHDVVGNTPTLRLEQDGSSGFAQQTWDVAGNETNFFIRDVTNGSRLPFRINPGAPSSSLHIASDGDMGFQTATPDGLFDVAHPDNGNDHAFLISPTGNVGVNIDNSFSPNGLFDVQTTGGISQFTIDTVGNIGIGTNAPTAPLEILRTVNTLPLASLTNAGQARLYMSNSTKTITGNEAQTWVLNSNGTFRITALNVPGKLFEVDTAGNLSISGGLTQGSDVNNKENIKPVNGQTILDALTQLPITTWNYKADAPTVRHLGPMAQDFYEKFKLGATEKGISSLDADGVALISIQQLNKNLLEKEQTINALKSRLGKLEQLVKKLSQEQ